MSRKILSFMGIFLLGSMGGIWAQAFLLPYFASTAPFQDWGFVQEWNSRTTIIREIHEVIINRDDAIQRGVERAEKAVVGIKSERSGVVREGSGFIATSDGFILTLARIVPVGYSVEVYLRDEPEPIEAQILKRDSDVDLVLLKIERGGLQTASFAQEGDLKLGMSVFLVGKIFESGEIVTIANQGIVKALSDGLIRTNIFEVSILGGSPLLDLEGRVLGLSTIDREGKVTAISSSILRFFSGL
ncbi:serine protease [Patescibacteria group bacterium]|nr:serine protease [Patescibacteria group bacterium]